MKFPIILLSIFFFFFACQSNHDIENKSSIKLKELIVPSIESGEPNLHVSANGQVYLSWIEYLNDSTDALLYAILKDENWSKPMTIATGSDWFVNWADFPSLATYNGTAPALAAHWLQTSAEGTYDYDIHIVQSMDGGKTWEPSFIPHRDSIAAEHGFVSMLPLSDERMFVTWLDGRNTKIEKSEESHQEQSGHGHHGAMTLRAASFDKSGNLYDEVELDNRICDCCQTSAAMTAEGIIVAYRDRSENEIRDISVVRQVNGKWTEPSTVFQDNWLIAGCPVNGPVIKANGNKVAVAWFTMKGEKGQVKVAFSNDNGETFQTPFQLDEGDALGRIDLDFLSQDEVLVTWMEKTIDAAEIRAVRVTREGQLGDSFLITTSSLSRKSGFPRMAKVENQILLAWTNVDSLTKVKTAFLNLE